MAPRRRSVGRAPISKVNPGSIAGLDHRGGARGVTLDGCLGRGSEASAGKARRAAIIDFSADRLSMPGW